MDSAEIITILAKILALMIAIVGHEIMHGYVAYLYGDNTAKNQGRLSINPIIHVDPIGTIVVPAILFISGAPFLFGWAKPVPINVRTVFDNGGYKGAIHVSLAGIAYNFALAFIAWILLNLFVDGDVQGYSEYFLVLFLINCLVYNIVLGVFNLYPIPPLDGSHALGYFGASMGWHGLVRFYDSIERYGMVILLLFIATPLSKYVFMPIHYLVSYALPLGNF